MIPNIPWRPGIGGANPRGVLTVRAGERWVCVLLCHGEEIPGCDVHWLTERDESAPCPGSDSCPLCKEGRPIQWKGYAPVLTTLTPLPYGANDSARVPLMLRIMQHKSRKVALEMTGQCYSLQGCGPGSVFVQARGPGRRNGRLEVIVPAMDPVPLAPGTWFDTRPYVQRMWAHHFRAEGGVQ